MLYLSILKGVMLHKIISLVNTVTHRDSSPRNNAYSLGDATIEQLDTHVDCAIQEREGQKEQKIRYQSDSPK